MKSFHLKIQQATAQRGLTLIELMLALLIGSFLLLGTLTVFTQSRQNFRVSDSVARLQENARFAIDTIEPDIRLTKFWGRNSDPGLIGAIPAGVVITCDTVDNTVAPATYTTWTLNLLQEIWAVDETSTYNNAALGIPCAARTAPHPQSDALVLRHAAGQPALPTPTLVQVHTDLARADIFNNGAIPAGYSAQAQTHNISVNVYYVDTSSDLDPNVSSLRVKTLGLNGVHQDQEVISGVENFQVQLGVDTTIPNDGTVDRYVDADHAIINPTTPGTIAGAQIVAVRLWMLMRSGAIENGYTDTTVYQTPDPNIVITPCAPGAGCRYPSNQRRLAVSKTIFLRNI